jgi:hypothetical protein
LRTTIERAADLAGTDAVALALVQAWLVVESLPLLVNDATATMDAGERDAVVSDAERTLQKHGVDLTGGLDDVQRRVRALVEAKLPAGLMAGLSDLLAGKGDPAKVARAGALLGTDTTTRTMSPSSPPEGAIKAGPLARFLAKPRGGGI